MFSLGTLFIAVALAMDAFTVSISGGAALKRPKFSQALLVGAYFGFFQFFMPPLGWYAGRYFRVVIDSYDHWIAFTLLAVIGGKMIVESFKKDGGHEFALSHKVLFVLAIATSIDALGIGLSYAFLGKPIFLPSITIGIMTFLFSVCGVTLGKMLKKLLKNKALLIGGVILLLIGFKVLADHGVFN
jgi:putative Mn2+ efflux pump MntP